MSSKLSILTVLLFFISVFQSAGQTKEQLLTNLDSINSFLYSDPNKAFEEAFKILETATVKNYPEVVASSHYSLGFFLNYQGNHAGAIEYYMLSLNYFISSNDTLKTGWLNIDIGNLYYHQGLYNEAEFHYDKALAIFNITGPITASATAYNNLGLVAIEKGKYDQALNYFNKALIIREKDNSLLFNLLHSYKLIGDLYYQTGDSIQAKYYYKMIINAEEFEDRENLRGRVHQSLAEIYLKTGSEVKAMKELQRAKDDFTVNFNAELLAHLDLRLADLSFAKSFNDSGLNYVMEALQLSESYSLIEIKRESLIKLISFYRKTKDHEQAFLFDSILDVHNEEVSRRNMNLALTGMRSELKLSIINHQLKENELMLKKNVQTRNILILLGIVILSAGLIVYWSLWQKKKNTEKDNLWKDRLFAILGHDLRSPFNTIIGLSGVLQDSNELVLPNDKKMIKGIHSTAISSYALLENLLAWSKSRNVNFIAEKENIDAHLLVNSSINEIRSNAELKEITLKTDIAKNAMIWADQRMLSVVLRNFLTNAVKFTGRGGLVTVSYINKSENQILCIEDTGVGISTEKLDNLLNTNDFMSEFGTENEKGSGLGLLICKEFIKQHNGVLKAESELGKGTKFYVYLPYSPQDT